MCDIYVIYRPTPYNYFVYMEAPFDPISVRCYCCAWWQSAALTAKIGKTEKMLVEEEERAKSEVAIALKACEDAKVGTTVRWMLYTTTTTTITPFLRTVLNKCFWSFLILYRPYPCVLKIDIKVVWTPRFVPNDWLRTK